MMAISDYEDPSLDYQFVNDVGTLSNLDNSEALLEQLRELGISVNRDYITLDIDYCMSGPNSLQDNYVSTESEPSSLELGIPDDDNVALESRTAGRFLRELPNGSPPRCSQADDPFRSLSISDDEEVVEAHFTADGNFKVLYDNLGKEYRSRVTHHGDHVRYLNLMHLEDCSEPSSASVPHGLKNSILPTIEQADSTRLGKLRSRFAAGIDRKLAKPIILIRRKPAGQSTVRGLREDFNNISLRFPPQLKDLPERCKHKIRRLLLGEIFRPKPRFTIRGLQYRGHFVLALRSVDSL